MPPVPLGTAPAPPIENARWIEPYPTGPDVEALASSRQSVTLAFVLALQHLPTRQRVVLLLRDVIGYEASEVAEMLHIGTTAVNSALIRARERMARFHKRHGAEPKIRALTPGQQELLHGYVRAWEAGDVDAIVALLSRDATVSMPPFSTWYRGSASIERWLAGSTFAETRSTPPSSRTASRWSGSRARGSPAWSISWTLASSARSDSAPAHPSAPPRSRCGSEKFDPGP